MKKIGFVGAYDKTDMIIYVSKILVLSGYKILIIDGTTLQKARYTVPCITPCRSYVTTFEDIDIAVGFEKIQQIINYTQEDMNYDYILIDIDNEETFKSFEMSTTDKNYFVTAFDNYSLKRGLDIIGKENDKIEMTKILFSAHMTKEEDTYLNFVSLYYPIQWHKEKIYFPFEIGDNSVIIDNQRNARISYKNLSMEYREGILELTKHIAPEISTGDIKKILKNI